MLKVSNIQTYGWQAAIRGMRNPMNSHAKEDSSWGDTTFSLGPNDLDLALRLIKAGPEHAKFLRMIHVQMDINGPLYWVAEHDTYKVGTTRNSCSFMHKGVSKPFEISDFSIEPGLESEFLKIIDTLNFLREEYLKTKENKLFFMIRQLLPQGYNVRYTWDASLQTVLSICTQRKGHKLDEWETFRQACFENIPYFTEFYNAMVGGNN